MDELEQKMERMKKTAEQQNRALAELHQHYSTLPRNGLGLMTSAEYYDGLKDRTAYRPPKDTSRREAESKAGISLLLKGKSLFSRSAKQELAEKKGSAAAMQQELEQQYQQRIEEEQAAFLQQQAEQHAAIDRRREAFVQMDREEILGYYNALLKKDRFHLCPGDTGYYDTGASVYEYNPANGTLACRYRLPNPSELNDAEEYFFDAESNSVQERKLSAASFRLLCTRFAQAALLREALRIHLSDDVQYARNILLLGYFRETDSAVNIESTREALQVLFPTEGLCCFHNGTVTMEELYSRYVQMEVLSPLYGEPDGSETRKSAGGRTAAPESKKSPAGHREPESVVKNVSKGS